MSENQTPLEPKPSVSPWVPFAEKMGWLCVGMVICAALFFYIPSEYPKIVNLFRGILYMVLGAIVLTFIIIFGFRPILQRFLLKRTPKEVRGAIEDMQYVSDYFTDKIIERLPDRPPYEVIRRMRDIIPGFANMLIWGRLRNWWWRWMLSILTVLAGFMGTILLMQQNKLLEAQNALLERQNIKIDTQTIILRNQNLLFARQNTLVDSQTVALDKQTNLFQRQNDLLDDQNIFIGKQTGLLGLQNNLLVKQNALAAQHMYLEEASRRSALIVLMSNIMDKVDVEIVHQDSCHNEVDGASLSLSLIGQIASLSYSFKPYRYMDGDGLIPHPLSPERGQLLLTLIGLPLDSATFGKIYAASTFEFADLHKADLSGAHLDGAHLDRAYLNEAHLNGAHLNGAHLDRAHLDGAYLNEAHLNEAHLNGAHMNGAHLNKADLSGAYLSGAFLYSADLTRAHLNKAHLNLADLNKATLTEAHLNETDLIRAQLNGAHLINAQLIGADLTGAYLIDAELIGSDFNGANFWFAHLNGANLNKADFTGANFTGAELSYAYGSTSKHLTSQQLSHTKNIFAFDPPLEIEKELIILRVTHPQIFEPPKTDRWPFDFDE